MRRVSTCSVSVVILLHQCSPHKFILHLKFIPISDSRSYDKQVLRLAAVPVFGAHSLRMTDRNLQISSSEALFILYQFMNGLNGFFISPFNDPGQVKAEFHSPLSAQALNYSKWEENIQNYQKGGCKLNSIGFWGFVTIRRAAFLILYLPEIIQIIDLFRNKESAFCFLASRQERLSWSWLWDTEWRNTEQSLSQIRSQKDIE